MRTIYLDEAERVARQSFSMWNREPASSSFGSFDRQYWGWKYKDFSDATMQYGVRLAVEYASARGLIENLPDFLGGYADYCASIQLADGSFNQCYPYERTPGVIYDILSTLVYVRRSPYLLDAGARYKLDWVIERAVAFALRTDEKHGEVSNHLAHYAYELLQYAEFSGDDKVKAKAREYIDRFLDAFEPDEGWFLEYNGPDPGYQSRCLRYLVKIADISADEELWSTVRLAAGFINEMLMPDGSIHPMLGCRSTALLYPSAFERLACVDASWRGLAARVREGWRNRKVPMPSEIDYGNAIRLADDALDAHNHLAGDNGIGVSNSDDLAESSGDRDFPKAGIHIRRLPDRAVFVASRLGGVIVAYSRNADSNWRLAYEDSGYLIKREGASWLTRMPGASMAVSVTKDRITVKAVFSRSLHDEVTPFRLIVLRILNLTLLRSQWIGDIFRKLVVNRLMNNGKAVEPLSLTREVRFSATAIEIDDRFEGRGVLTSADSEVFRCRRTIGTHMASSRYFQEEELEGLGLHWIKKIAWPIPPGESVSLKIEV